MASVLLVPDNLSEDKHVESRLVPRLDESSNLSSSTVTNQISEDIDSGKDLLCGGFTFFMKKAEGYRCAGVLFLFILHCETDRKQNGFVTNGRKSMAFFYWLLNGCFRRSFSMNEM